MAAGGTGSAGDTKGDGPTVRGAAGQGLSRLPQNAIPIGLFAQLTRLTRKSLKTYERYGLLQPACVNPENRYRLYTLRQVRDAATIRLLRSVGIPLRDIASALRDDDAVPLPVLVERRRVQLTMELAAADRLLADLAMITSTAHGGLDMSVGLRDVGPCPAIVQSAMCRFETHERVIDGLLDRAGSLAAEYGLAPAGRETVAYHTELDLTRDFTVEARLPVHVPDGATLPPEFRTVPAQTCAVTLHRGPFGAVDATVACLLSWIDERDCHIAGPISETYLVDERDTDDVGAYLTELRCPVTVPTDPTPTADTRRGV
jgi:DNA-binding transcriptional MerR regulator/effector-binding domain-containing protein